MIKAQSKRAGGGLGPGESKHLKGSTTKPQATEVLLSLWVRAMGSRVSGHKQGPRDCSEEIEWSVGEASSNSP